MARKYPFWKGIDKIAGHVAISRQCVLCGEFGSDRVAIVQVNWFRGDDIVKPVHHSCITKLKHDERAKAILDFVKATK